MEKNRFEDALATAKLKLQILQDQRVKIERESVEWKRVFDSLSAVTEDVPGNVLSTRKLREGIPS